MSTMRAVTIPWIATLLFSVGIGADDRPADLEHGPHLISTALRKMAKGVNKVLKHTAAHGNTTAAPLFQFHSGQMHAAQTLEEIETGINEVAMSIEDWVAQVSKNDKARKESDAHDAVLANEEMNKLKRATARVRNASHARSAPKAAEIARLQKIKDQLNAEIRKRMPPPPTVAPKEPLASGNIHALAKYLFAPPRRDEIPAQKPASPPKVAVPSVDQNASHVQHVRKPHKPVTAKELAEEVMRKNREIAKQQIEKEEAIAEAARNASLAAVRYKKVKMSRKLRGYLHMPTSPPPVTAEKRKEAQVSPGHKHLLAAADILAKMSDAANSSAIVAPATSTHPVRSKASVAPLAPEKAATSALQLSKFWGVTKDSTNVWPWVKGGVHM
jgi:hypothetical protein